MNRIEKRNATSLKKFGVKSYSQTEDFKIKRSKTCIEKYNSQTPLGSNEIREKAKITCKQKYGSEFWSSSEYGRKKCIDIRASEMNYEGEFFTLEETKEIVKSSENDTFFGLGAQRHLLKTNPKLFFSILKYTEDMNNVKNITLGARAKYLKGEFIMYKCPDCGTYFTFDRAEHTLWFNYKDPHRPKKYSHEYFKLKYPIDGLEREKHFKETFNKFKVKVNSKQYYIEKYGEDEGLTRYYSANMSRIKNRKKCSYSKESQELFFEICKKNDIDLKCAYFALNNEEKKFELSSEESKKYNKTCFYADFCCGSKIIEYNGTYWHSTKEQRLNDIKKQDYFNKLGYKILFLWSDTPYDENIKIASDFLNEDRYEVLTKAGFSKFEGIRKSFSNNVIKITTEKNEITCTQGHKFVINGQDKLAYELEKGDYLETLDGLVRILDISKEKSQDVYDILETNDHTFVTNDIISHNCFIGSSYTLINADTLNELYGIDELDKKDGKLDIFIKPKNKHKYIMSVDPAKDGSDSFSVKVLDITKFPFVQVASCGLQIDYFKMPEYLNEWGHFYNNALIIVENNEGAGQSVADMLWYDYEYENLFFDKVKSTNTTSLVEKRKKYPGFRTTVKTRKLILDTLKLFLENKNLVLYDKKTINEFYTFVLINGKYQAEDGYHDDHIMSLALAFAPFMNLRNFNDMKALIDSFYSNDKEKIEDFTEFMTIGYFDY